jgi:hypothetical protein
LFGQRPADGPDLDVDIMGDELKDEQPKKSVDQQLNIDVNGMFMK